MNASIRSTISPWLPSKSTVKLKVRARDQPSFRGWNTVIVISGRSATYAGRSVGAKAPAFARSRLSRRAASAPALKKQACGGANEPEAECVAVYSDGLSTYSAAGFPESGTACFKHLGEAAGQSLRADLAAAGAFGLADVGFIGADIPLTTITVFSRSANGWSRARTYSYGFIIGERYVAVNDVIQDFLDEHFPDGCGVPGG